MKWQRGEDDGEVGSGFVCYPVNSSCLPDFFCHPEISSCHPERREGSQRIGGMVVVMRRLRKGGGGERFLSAFGMTKRGG